MLGDMTSLTMAAAVLVCQCDLVAHGVQISSLGNLFSARIVVDHRHINAISIRDLLLVGLVSHFVVLEHRRSTTGSRCGAPD